MKTEKAIQVLSSFNKWRRADKDIEQPDPWIIGEAIDDVLMAIDEMKQEAELHRGAITGWQNKWECAVELAAKAKADLNEERKEGEEQARLLGMGSEREAKLIAERDLWRAEAQRWREQALDLEAQIETAIKRIQWRQDNLDRGIKELKV
jgi:hypothetical protein